MGSFCVSTVTVTQIHMQNKTMGKQANTGFPGGSDGKEPTCSAGDLGSASGLRRSPGGRNGSPLQDSCLGNPMERGAWRATVRGVAHSRTRLKRLSVQACRHASTHTVHLINEAAGVRLGSPGGARGKELTYQCRRRKSPEFEPWVRKIPWRRKWQPTPGFLPGESHGQRSLVGSGP